MCSCDHLLRPLGCVWPRWPLWHWPKSLKSLLHMSVKQEWHRLSLRHWDCEYWKIHSRPTVWKVKMRLLVGFCRHLTKANFLSLSIAKLETIEVRGLFSVLDSWVFISVLLCFTAREIFISLDRKRGSWASLSITQILFYDDGWRSTPLSFISHLLLICFSFLQPRHWFFILFLFFYFFPCFRRTEYAVKQAVGFAEGREESKVGS